MMKKIFSFLPLLLIFPAHIYCQIPEIKGKPIVEIFTDFHLNLNDTARTSGFGLERAYLGYNFLAENNFSARFIINIGSPDELPPASTSRRYAYFREASISYTGDRLHVSFGITTTRHFDFQQKFWGKRYIANTFQSLHDYGNTADLGVVVDYRFSDIFSGDFTVMNGEGYSELQLDNGVKTSAGLTITPSEQFAFRVYGDINKQFTTWQYTLLTFAGFKNEVVKIGAEFNYKTNLDLLQGDNSWGISGTGALKILKSSEIFARYDYSASVTPPDENRPWNFLNDGSLVILGFQQALSSNVKIALDYQQTVPTDNELQSMGFIFVNTSFRF
jgi:hypothetical protein